MAGPNPTFEDASHKVFTITGIGDFDLRRPSFPDYSTMERLKTSLVGAGADPTSVGTFTANCQIVINTLAKSKPRGFSWEVVSDLTPWFRFMSEYQDWIASFQSSLGESYDPPAGSLADPNNRQA